VAIEPDESPPLWSSIDRYTVNGDVSKPVSKLFVHYDVRQAIALSGGYDILRLPKENPFFCRQI